MFVVLEFVNSGVFGPELADGTVFVTTIMPCEYRSESFRYRLLRMHRQDDILAALHYFVFPRLALYMSHLPLNPVFEFRDISPHPLYFLLQKMMCH